jgi:selenocysteine-specific elongation factor
LSLLKSDPYSPPTDSPIEAEVLGLLADEGRVVRVSETVVFAASAYAEMVDRISKYIRENDDISVADVRDMFGASRKYALALLEHLDQRRITRRVGDAHVLR